MVSENTELNESISLIQLQGDFIQELELKGRSPNTLKNYKTDLACFNGFLRSNNIGDQIAKFRSEYIREYGAYLQDRYSSDNSRRRRVQALRLFFDFLVNHNQYPENPVKKLASSPKKLDIPRPLSLTELKTLWQCIDQEGHTEKLLPQLVAKRNQLVVLLIYGSGLKVSDVSGLLQEHILEGETMRVLVTPPKRDPYTVPLPKAFKNIYFEYCQLLGEGKKASSLEFTKLLFNANPYRILNGGLSPRGIEVVLEEYRKKLLISATPKNLRQACIFKWLHQRVDASTIKEWLGVAPSYSLKIYNDHLSDHAFNDAFLDEPLS